MVTKKGKKISGGKYIQARKKKLCERPGQKRTVKLGEEKRRTKRTMGGNEKTFMLKAQFINVEKDKKTTKTEIKNVLETPSNRFLARQNVLTKGTIVETELGKARVTNRPTQEGVVNGVLLKE
ncbi:30S ribosomal protein S8e [Candidatus Pacearchaeota archaeon]|nr:30S ribosomal protein S8e [Candidatus Pacearchaeota archaeon]